MAQRFGLTNLSRGLAWVSGAGMLLASVWIAADVALRLLVNYSISGSVEVSGYFLAVGSAWAFAYALVSKSHVRVDTFYMLLPRKLRPWLDVVALLSLGFVVSVLSYRAVELTVVSYQFGSRSRLQVPLWIPQGLWAFGITFFLLAIVVLTVLVLRALLKGNTDGAAELTTASLDAELKAELANVEQRRTR